MDSASATSRRKVTGSMNHKQKGLEALLEALMEEDRLLRQRLAKCPRDLREIRGPDGALSFKETLGHIAYWDSFAVEFFTRKLDVGSYDPEPPVDFEGKNKEALRTLELLPFGEVLVRYLESTGALVDFLKGNWERLGEMERRDFWVPVKHRRQHRLVLLWESDSAREEENYSRQGLGEMDFSA